MCVCVCGKKREGGRGICHDKLKVRKRNNRSMNIETQIDIPHIGAASVNQAWDVNAGVLFTHNVERVRFARLGILPTSDLSTSDRFRTDLKQLCKGLGYTSSVNRESHLKIRSVAARELKPGGEKWKKVYSTPAMT